MADILVLKSKLHREDQRTKDYSNFLSIDEGNWDLIDKVTANRILFDLNAAIAKVQPTREGRKLVTTGVLVLIIGLIGTIATTVLYFVKVLLIPEPIKYLFGFTCFGALCWVFGNRYQISEFRKFIENVDKAIAGKQPQYLSEGLNFKLKRNAKSIDTTANTGFSLAAKWTTTYEYSITVSWDSSPPSYLPTVRHGNSDSVTIPMENVDRPSATY